ncbi:MULTISPECIES: hypothetical protein [Pseudomonas]|uniref:Uncharacterized protein n=1 Tax=Pseudomonas fulva TaxID=47880 RepID=A0A0D0KHD5_9PSED|nr:MULTISPECIES: hypothetical protein [Pseudomonas]KIP98734.1 hypothetical protein RU08_14770 [Pseudomonas fulva]
MENIVIKTLDFFAGLLIVLSLVAAAFAILFAQNRIGVLTGLGIFVGACFTCGFWMAVSKIIDNQERMIVINKRLLQSMEKIGDGLSEPVPGQAKDESGKASSEKKFSSCP